MCQIFYLPAGVMPKKDDFATAVDVNPDGWGMSAATGDDLEYKYATFTTDAATKKDRWENDVDGAWAAMEKFKDVPRSMHLRYNTVGDTDLSNAHPFIVTSLERDESQAISLMHNGTISSYRPAMSETTKKGMSDTANFVEELIEPLFQSLVKSYPGTAPWSYSWVQDLLQRTAGTNNRLLFLNDQGEYYIHAEKSGTWIDDGIWVANTYSFNSSHRTKYDSNTYYGASNSYVSGGSTTPAKKDKAKDNKDWVLPWNSKAAEEKAKITPMTPVSSTTKTGSGEPKAQLFNKDMVTPKFSTEVGVDPDTLIYLDPETVSMFVTESPEEAMLLVHELQVQVADARISNKRLQTKLDEAYAVINAEMEDNTPRKGMVN